MTMNTQPNTRSSVLNIALLVAFAVMMLLMGSHQFAQASDDHGSKMIGVVESKPSEGKIGEWTIGGKNFDVGRFTRIEQENGLLTVGSCVKVEYRQIDSTNKAFRIERKRAQECGLPGSTIPQPTPVPVKECDEDESGDDVVAGHDGKEKGCRVVGRITALPDSGFMGIWGIDNISYTVDADTKLRTSSGMFVVDACVKAEYVQTESALLIKEMHTTHAFRCDGDVDDEGRHGGEMFGVINSFPLSSTGFLTGEWTIGGKLFIADNTTEFKQEKLKFAEGVMVKVKFWTDVNEVNHAMKIETKFRKEDDGDDDDDNGSHDGAEGMAAGRVITVPENRIGVWVIGGIEYTTNISTTFHEKRGAADVGAIVRVRYHLDADSTRIVDSIKTLAIPGQPSEYENAHLVGIVEVTPTDGLSGTWTIAGETFQSDKNTEYEEERGVLAVGAYVRVEFKVVDGVKVALEMKTLVAPGAGESDHIGEVEQNDDDETLAAAGVAATGVWVIGGKSYIITDGTVFSTANGTLNVGDTAMVNSYTAPDGSEVATRIQGGTFSVVYLPTISR